MTIKKVLFYLALIIVVLAIILGLYLLVQIVLPVGANDSEVTFSISSGQSVSQIASGLETNELIRDGFVFKVYVLLTGESDNLQAGNYLLNQNMSLTEVLDKLTTGEVASNEVRLTFPEGWRADQMGEYLESLNIVTADNYLGYVETSDTREYLSAEYYSFLTSKPSDQGIEGFLYPDTYLVFQEATAPEIIKKQLDNFDQKLTSEIREDIASQGQTIYEIVTLASIIEKEARKSADRKILAGVFKNRLEIGMALQSDATVNYITGKKTTRPSSEDIETDSLYNTYQHAGLPPGPICNPSLDAIEAAVYPTASDYLYYITAPDGTAYFSKTYEDHLRRKNELYGN